DNYCQSADNSDNPRAF
nr:immunoglobulin light chain junction region [Macaca mulatta]